MVRFRKKLAKLNRRVRWNWLNAAIGLYIYANVLDTLTTYIGVNLFNFAEGNPIMAGPNGSAPVFWALLVKLFYTLLIIGALTYFIYKGTKSWALASVPFWYKGVDLLFTADMFNMGAIFHAIRIILNGQ